MFKKLLSVVLVGIMALSLAGFNWFGGGANKASNYSDADFKDYCYCYIDVNGVLHFTSKANKAGACVYSVTEYGHGPYFMSKPYEPMAHNEEILTDREQITEVTFDDKVLFDTEYDKLNFFERFYKLKKINHIENFIVKKMSDLFSHCYSLETLDLSGMDVSHVKTMHGAFSSCENLKSLNVSTWNTSKVEDMSYMFSSCKKLTSLDLSSFDTSNVKSMGGMFKCCSELIVLNTTNWDVSNVKDIREMFNQCSEFKDNCEIDVNNLKFPKDVRFDNQLFLNSSVKADWWDKRERKMKNN